MVVKERDRQLEALRDAREALRELASNLERADASLTELQRDEGDTSVRELAERFHLSEEAVVAFVQTTGELLGGQALAVKDARRAGMLAAAATAWENELGALLSSAQVRGLLGDISRQRVDELLRAHRLIAPRDRSGRRRFPIFQFRDGRPVETLIAAYWTVADATADEWTAASWCVAPDSALEGGSPAQWARADRDPGRLLQVARQDAARLAQ